MDTIDKILLQEALAIARETKEVLMQKVLTGEATFWDLRRLDMDIRTCENGLRRMA